MAYSLCLSWSAAVPDPALSFRPSFGGRIREASGQERPLAPAAGRIRNIDVPVFAAGILLVIAVAAVLVQTFILHPVALLGSANASTSPSPLVTPDVDGIPEIPATSGSPPPDVNTMANRPGSGPSSPVLLTTSVSSPASTSVGPLITITGTQPYTSHATALGSSPKVPVIDGTSLAARVHKRVNRVRQENGRSVLGTDAALASLARAHSTDMAAHGYFGHVNLDERDATARGAAAGYRCYKTADPSSTYAIAENIFATYRHSSILLVNGRAVESEGKSEEEIARETVDAWMNSPDHRENILNPGVAGEGIGVAIAKDDLVFVTEDFC